MAAGLPQCAVSPTYELCESSHVSNIEDLFKRSCFVTAVGASNCAMSNQTCICHNEDISAQSTACVTKACTVRESLTSKNLTTTFCGIAPNVDHSYVPVLMAFTAIAAVCVLLRVIARLKAKVPVWWDDFIVAVSFVSRPLLLSACFGQIHG